MYFTKFILIIIFNILFLSRLNSKETESNSVIIKANMSYSQNQTRYKKESNQILFLEGSFRSFAGAAEKRNNNFLGSGLFQNKYFFFAHGYRYKPFSGFYFLSEPTFFSSFYEINQPLRKSSFLGIKLYQFQTGIFVDKEFSHKKPSFYLILPFHFISFAYSMEAKNFFLGTNIKDQKVYKNLFVSSSSEVIFQHKKMSSGYFQNELKNQFLYSVSFQINGYKQIFNLNTSNYMDNNEKIENKELNKISLLFESDDVLEYILYIQGEDRYQVTRFNLPLKISKYGKLNFGAGVVGYHQEFIKVYKFYYDFSSLEFLKLVFGIESKENKDYSIETKLLFLLNYWEMELSFLFQNQNNKLKTYFESWYDSQITQCYFSDYSELLKIRFSNQFVAFYLSYSKKDFPQKTNLWFNIQFLYKF